MSGKSKDPVERFWPKVDKSIGFGPNGDCWEWIGGKYQNGYGQFYDGAKKTNAHRFSYRIIHGPISDNLNVCHVCDNIICVNPDHLFLGTQKDNIQDMIQKNRKVNGDQSGIKNGRARLNWTKVGEIRELYSKSVTILKLARVYGVGETTIRHIVNGNTWITKGEIQ